MCLFELESLSFLDIRPGVGSYGSSIYTFKGTSILSSSVAVPLRIPIDSVGGFLMCAILSHLLCGDFL